MWFVLAVSCTDFNLGSSLPSFPPLSLSARTHPRTCRLTRLRKHKENYICTFKIITEDLTSTLTFNVL